MNARNTKPAERQRPRGRREAIQHRQYLGRPRLARTFSRQRGQYLSVRLCKVPKGRAQPGAERRRREEAGCDNLYGRGVLFSLCQTERRRVQIDLSARCRYACFSNISAPTAPCSRIDLYIFPACTMPDSHRLSFATCFGTRVVCYRLIISGFIFPIAVTPGLCWTQEKERSCI